MWLGEKSTSGRKEMIVNGILDLHKRIRNTESVNYMGKQFLFLRNKTDLNNYKYNSNQKIFSTE